MKAKDCAIRKNAMPRVASREVPSLKKTTLVQLGRVTSSEKDHEPSRVQTNTSTGRVTRRTVGTHRGNAEGNTPVSIGGQGEGCGASIGHQQTKNNQSKPGKKGNLAVCWGKTRRNRDVAELSEGRKRNDRSQQLRLHKKSKGRGSGGMQCRGKGLV